MEYLNRVLGIHVIYDDDPVLSVPNYIHNRYRLQKVTLDGKTALFAYPGKELDTVSAIKKQFDRIENTEGAPVVLVPERLSYRQKEYLLREHIPFIVDGRQIYLPFMAIYLQEKNDAEKKEIMSMLPSAQLLLLFYIYHGCGEQLTSDASRQLGFTPTSISRASKQLEDLGLLLTVKRGVQKVIYTDKTPKELFEAARGSLANPVKRIIYVPKAIMKDNLLTSSYTALSEYTLLNPSAVTYFAAGSISVWEKEASVKLQSTDEQCAVELWRYDPKKLSAGKNVDRLSLALALGGDRDERVEQAVEEMLEQVWRDLDGKGN